MLPPTLTTWVLVIFGLVFVFAILLYGQILMVLRPHSQKTKDLLIGKGEDWRDKTHFRFSVGGAWADLLFWLPMLLTGSIGVLFGYRWGYVLWAVSGGISAYISIILWFTDFFQNIFISHINDTTSFFFYFIIYNSIINFVFYFLL